MIAIEPTPLVIRFGRLGDMVLQAPLLHLLRRRFEQPCTLLTSGNWSQALFGASDDVGEIWELRSKHTPVLLSVQRLQLIYRLQRHSGPVYVSEDVPRQVWKIRRLLTLADVAPTRCLFLTDGPQQDEHWVDRLLRFGAMTPQAFGSHDQAPAKGDYWTAPRLSVAPQSRIDRDNWLSRRGLAGRPLVLLQPGNKRAMKRWRPRAADPKAWPTDHWASLLRTMRTTLPNASLMLCGSPLEHRLLRKIREASGVEAEVATADLPISLLLATAEVAHSMVSVDTGPAHVAAAAGCPLVVLYGAESPGIWSRRSPTNSPIFELGGPPQTNAVSEIPLHEVTEAWSRLAAIVTRSDADDEIKSE